MTPEIIRPVQFGPEAKALWENPVSGRLIAIDNGIIIVTGKYYL
jgi:hypothetical protein